MRDSRILMQAPGNGLLSTWGRTSAGIAVLILPVPTQERSERQSQTSAHVLTLKLELRFVIS